MYNTQDKLSSVSRHDLEDSDITCNSNVLTLKGPGIFTVFHVGANLKV